MLVHLEGFQLFRFIKHVEFVEDMGKHLGLLAWILENLSHLLTLESNAVEFECLHIHQDLSLDVPLLALLWSGHSDKR